MTVFPQGSNVHIGANAGTSKNFGLTGPTYGITGGGDYRKSDWLVSADAEYIHLCKYAGCGYQVNARGSVARFISKDFAIQGGVREGYYNVHVFNKSSLQVFGGVRFGGRVSTEFNYRHDLNSPNREHIGEVRITGYLSHHVFFRAESGVTFFTQAHRQYTGIGGTYTVGIYR